MESTTLLNLINLKRSNLIRLKDLLNTNNLDELKKALEIQEHLNYKINIFKKHYSIDDIPPLNLDLQSTPHSSNSNLVIFNSVELFNNTINNSQDIKKKIFEEEAKNLFPSQNNIYMSKTPDVHYAHDDIPFKSEQKFESSNQFHEFINDKNISENNLDNCNFSPIKTHEPVNYHVDKPLENYPNSEDPELLFNNYISSLEKNPIEETKLYTSIEEPDLDDLDEYSPYS